MSEGGREGQGVDGWGLKRKVLEFACVASAIWDNRTSAMLQH